MCDVLEVTRQGYYAWRKRPKSDQQKANETLTETIKDIFDEHFETYGSPRIYQVLRQRDYVVGENRVARLMREAGLSAAVPSKKPYTTDSTHTYPIVPNILDRQFDVDELNTVWAGDVTHIETEAGWLYLAVVLDLGSRRVIGWSMKPNKSRNLANSALDMALRWRSPSDKLLHHSDQGAQYASTDYRTKLNENNIESSMSKRGDCLDNAVVESFFSSLKREKLNRYAFTDRDTARQSVFEYIDLFYNRKRIHSTLDYMSPAQYEQNLTV
jgi:transposase InsO family protein